MSTTEQARLEVVELVSQLKPIQEAYKLLKGKHWGEEGYQSKANSLRARIGAAKRKLRKAMDKLEWFLYGDTRKSLKDNFQLSKEEITIAGTRGYFNCTLGVRVQ